MSWENLGKTISLPVAADHSSNQWKFMKINSSGQQALCSVLGEMVDGVSQDNPAAAGRAGSIMVGTGVTMITLGATLAAGAAVSSSAAGVAVASAAGYSQAGKLLVGGVATNVVPMLFTPGGLVNMDAAQGRQITLPAAADYSTTGQYLTMQVDSSGEWVRVTGDGALCNGVLQNAPDVGEDAIVCVDGVCTVKIGADATAAGAQVESETTTSRAIAITQDAIPFGTLLAGGDDGDDVLMIVQIGMAGWTQA